MPLQLQRHFEASCQLAKYNILKGKLKALTKYFGRLGGVPKKVILPKMSFWKIQKSKMKQM